MSTAPIGVVVLAYNQAAYEVFGGSEGLGESSVNDPELVKETG